MRAVEALLSEKPQRVHDLAATVYGVQPGAVSRGQVETVRRACKRLAELDRASLTRVRADVKPWGYGSRQKFLAVRTALTDEERQAAERRALAAARALGQGRGRAAATADPVTTSEVADAVPSD
jgi:hypothetical protein